MNKLFLKVWCCLGALAAACQLEPKQSDQLLDVTVDDAQVLYANGDSQATVTITFVGNVSPGKSLTVTTSLGILNPAATAGQERTLALTTGTSSERTLTLYAERTAGKGKVTVTGPGGLSDSDDFEIKPVDDDLTLGGATTGTADGRSSVELTLDLATEDPDARDVTLKTSAGVLSPEKAGEAARQRVVKVRPGSQSVVELYAPSATSTAVVTAELGSELESWVVNFTALGDPVVQLGEDTTGTADGKSSVQLTLDLTSDDPDSKDVTLKTNLGVLSPEKAGEAARQRILKVKPGQQALFDLYAPSTTGTAVVTAELGAALDTQIVIFGSTAERSATIEAADAVADGVTVAPITLGYTGPDGEVGALTLTTTLGVLNPAASADAQRQTVRMVKTGGTDIAYLEAGTISGQAVLTVSGEGIRTATRTINLARALPDSLFLSPVDSSVFDSGRSQISISALLHRGTGSVSRGTPIGFMACCDSGNELSECNELVSVPPLHPDDDGDARETVNVVLTPNGQTLVSTEGSAPNEDTPVLLHAFVPKSATAPTCTELDAETADVGPQDSISLVLRKLPPAP